jgi:hypothetical protein
MQNVLATVLLMVFGAFCVLAGFYARTVLDRITILVEDKREEREAKTVGVIRPIGHQITKSGPINLEAQSGPVRKPTPAEIEDERTRRRSAILQENHR